MVCRQNVEQTKFQTDKISNRQNVDRQNVDRQNVDRQNVAQTKCQTDKMSNIQNVDRQNAKQTKCRQIFYLSIYFFLQFFYAEKQCGRQFWNAVEREPVETRALNPTASEASYKPKQRSYRTTNLKKKKFCRRINPAPKCPAPNCPAPKRRRRNGGAESAAPKRTRPA